MDGMGAMRTMSEEYINRNALIDDLIHNRSFYPAIVKNAIKAAPAVELVEVVRCGECIYALMSLECNPDSRLCNLNYYSDGGRKIVSRDGFCHLGRRKRSKGDQR